MVGPLDTLIRWFRNPAQRRADWQNTSQYWFVIRRLERWRFYIWRRIIAVTAWMRSRGEFAVSLRQLIQTGLGSGLIGVGLVVGLPELEAFALDRAGFMRRFGDRLGSDFPIDVTTYRGLLIALVQISGIFLGLYFTAVSLVASTVYARAPTDVRNLLLGEKLGNLYIKLVALLGALSILIIVRLTLGFPPAHLNLAVICIVGVIVLVNFVTLGLRILNFFDPMRLTRSLRDDLVLWMGDATPDGLGWRNPEVQAQHQRQAEEALLTFRNVVEMLTGRGAADPRSLRGLAQLALRLSASYSREKNRIPSHSRWFKSKLRHPDWFLTDFSRLDLALKTGTPILPDQVPDLMWFENHLAEIFSESLEKLLSEGELGETIALCECFLSTLGEMADNLDFDGALSLFRTYGDLVRSHVTDSGSDASDGDHAQMGDLTLTIVDYHCLGVIQILLGVSRRMTNVTAQTVADSIGEINWDSPKTIYETGLPRGVVFQLERMLEQVAFEEAVERQLVSPAWYREQFVASGLMHSISTGIGDLTSELEKTFACGIETHPADERPILCARVAARGLEAHEKYLHHLAVIEGQYEALSELRQVDDIIWPTLNWSQLRTRADNVREGIIVRLGQIAPSLSAIPPTDDRPDYFGHAYSVLGLECYRAMSNGEEALFESIFPSMFNASLIAHEKLPSRLSQMDYLFGSSLFGETLVDICSLSGYAAIYGELDQKSFWPLVRSTWDRYLANHSNPSEVLTLLDELAHGHNRLGFTPREVVRTSWNTELLDKLSNRGLIEDFSPFGPLGAGVRSQHSSPLVRTIVRRSIGLVSPEDVFLALYLEDRPQFEDLPRSKNVRSFAESLHRERWLDVPT